MKYEFTDKCPPNLMRVYNNLTESELGCDDFTKWNLKVIREFNFNSVDSIQDTDMLNYIEKNPELAKHLLDKGWIEKTVSIKPPRLVLEKLSNGKYYLKDKSLNALNLLEIDTKTGTIRRMYGIGIGDKHNWQLDRNSGLIIK